MKKGGYVFDGRIDLEVGVWLNIDSNEEGVFHSIDFNFPLTSIDGSYLDCDFLFFRRIFRNGAQLIQSVQSLLTNVDLIHCPNSC